VKDYTIKAGEREMISTGISMELPLGYVALVWDKSGLAAKKGVTVFGGVIDSHYRGEYKVILYNSSSEDFHIQRGMRLAQMAFQEIIQAQWAEVDSLEQTTRSSGGFGHTGH